MLINNVCFTKFRANYYGNTTLKATVPTVLPQQWFPLPQ